MEKIRLNTVTAVRFFLLTALLMLAAGSAASLQGKESDRINIWNGLDYRWGDSPVGAKGIRLWANDRSDTWGKFDLPQSPPGRKGNDRLWVRVKLPAGSWKNPAILTRGIHQAAEVYCGNTVIYRFGEILKGGGYVFPGYRWFHIIPLPEKCAGNYVYFRFHSQFQSIGLSTLSIGEESEHVRYLIRADTAKFSIGVILITIGLIAVVYFLARLSGRRAMPTGDSRRMLAFFALFCLCMGIAVIADTRIKEFIVDAPRGWLYIRLGGIYFMMVGGAGFLGELIQERFKKIIMFLRYTYLLYGAGAVTLSLVGIVPVMSTILPFNILLLAGVIVMVVVVALLLLRGDTNARIFTAGFIVLTVSASRDALVDIGFLPRYEFIQHWGILVFIACLGIILINRVREMNSRYYGYVQELEIARNIQTSIMPKSIPAVSGLDISACYIPMETVGGDFFGFHTPGKRQLGIYISDVVGHGIPAALISSMAKITFELESHNAHRPDTLLAEIHRKLYPSIQNNFFTANYVYIDLDRMLMLNGNAGHPPLFLWRRSEEKLLEFKPRGRMIGPFEDNRFDAEEIVLLPGDRVVLYTDGIIEAQNGEGEMFGEDSFKRFIVGSGGYKPDECVQRLVSQIRRWTGSKIGFTDDVTLVIADIA